MRFLKYFFVFAAIVVAVVYFQYRKSNLIVLYGDTMGTYYSVKIKSSNNFSMLNNKIKEELQLINSQMSVFDPNSEISKINQAEAGVWMPLSEDLSTVMKAAYDIYVESNGNFDPTVGKLVDLWGFGVSQQKKLPSDDEIKEVLKYSGFDKIKFSADYKMLKKKYSETYVNLSAIAKGYAVDRIAILLQSMGYTDFVVEIGGEVRASGNRAEGEKGWNVAVVNPQDNENAFVVSLENYSVATSGDYRNFHVVEGKIYSHTISPKNGRPVQHNLASVTIFRKKCMRADGLATAIMAMGEKKGMEFATKLNLPVILFTKDMDNNFQLIVSPAAKKLIGE